MLFTDEWIYLNSELILPELFAECRMILFLAFRYPVLHFFLQVEVSFSQRSRASFNFRTAASAGA